MTRKEQNKILDAKIESNINQYKVDRLNAEISAFSSGDSNKYEFLKRIDLNYKPNALDKAIFEFSLLGKIFSTGLDKTAQGCQEEGITKLLQDIRDSLAGNVIIPARPPRPNDNGNDDGNDNGEDNGDDDDNGNDKKSFIDLSWMTDLQLYKKIASEVFSRYNGDKHSFELFTLRTFIDNINNERVKNKKDAREEFKIIKINVKSEALKEIVKDLEQAIFGDDDDKDKEELKEAEELDRRFKNLISKKRRESLRGCLKESEDANPQDRVNALRKKLNNLPKTSSDETSDNNDSEDNQISNFVDKVLKKVRKEIVNDDNKDTGDNISLKSNQKRRKNITEQLKSSENLLDKQIRDAKNKDREKYKKKVDETKEAQSASKEVGKFNKMVNNGKW